MKVEMGEGLVSIITPAYNCEKYISECIESVLSQTYVHWEMIIVNDKSTDKTQTVIEKYTKIDSRIFVINLEENSGAAIARNTALDVAKGRYIAFLDADDKWKRNKLEKQLSFMMMNGYAYTFTGYEYILDQNNAYKKTFHAPVSLNYSQLLKSNRIGCLTVIIDRDIVGDFRMPNIRSGEDQLTWLLILKRGFLAYGLNENLAEYRRVTGSLSNNKFKAMKRQWHNFRKVLKLPLYKSLFYYFYYALEKARKYYFMSWSRRG